MNIVSLRTFIQSIHSKSYLSDFVLDTNEYILENALKVFHTDYERWYPKQEMSVEKLYYTPQLVSVLMYRIARIYNERIPGGVIRSCIRCLAER